MLSTGFANDESKALLEIPGIDPFRAVFLTLEHLSFDGTICHDTEGYHMVKPGLAMIRGKHMVGGTASEGHTSVGRCHIDAWNGGTYRDTTGKHWYLYLYSETYLIHGLRQLSTIVSIHDEFQNGKRYKIHDLLTRFGGSQATNPRDKVFALLGLAASTRLGNGSGLEPTQTIINYTRSVQETFIHVAEVLIQQDASVDKLLAAGIGWKRSIPGLPS